MSVTPITVPTSNFTTWMSSIIHEEKNKILEKISEEHGIPIASLEKYNQVSDSQVQEYIDIFSNKKSIKTKNQPQNTETETETKSKSKKSKKEKDIEVTQETIKKMKVPDMKYVLKTRYNDTEVDSINAKTKEDREKLRNRLLEKYKSENSTNDTSENENSEESTPNELNEEPNTLSTENQNLSEPKAEKKPKVEKKTSVEEKDSKETQETQKKTNVEEEQKPKEDQPKEDQPKEDQPKEDQPKKIRKKKITKSKKNDTTHNGCTDSVSNEDYENGVDIHYNPHTSVFTLSSLETDSDWNEYKLVKVNNNFYCCTEDKKIVKTLTLTLTESNESDADEYEEFITNFELTEDMIGSIFSNGNDIILNKELSTGLSGYKNYYVINKWIIFDDEDDDDDEELSEDQGAVWKLLTITEV